jgi:hypothetical protein
VIGRDRIVTPDQVRGSYPTLEAGVKAGNWPKLKDARGKFVFLLLTALDTGACRAMSAGIPIWKDARLSGIEAGAKLWRLPADGQCHLAGKEIPDWCAGLSGARPRRYRNLGSQDQ